MQWIHHANLFDMPKGCREMYHSARFIQKVQLLYFALLKNVFFFNDGTQPTLAFYLKP